MNPKKFESTEQPIPVILSIHLAFIDPDLDEDEYEREVRRVIREQIKHAFPGWIMPEGADEVPLMEEYDDWLRGVIREELLRN